MATYESPPSNKKSLAARIKNVAGDQEAANRRELFMAMAVVGQMLPNGVVKGGGGMVFRYGPGVRATKDLDAARTNQLQEYLDEFEEKLFEGWSGFTGTLKEENPANPQGVPDQYVTRKYSVSVAYQGEIWRKVKIDLAQNEIGIADEYEEVLSGEIAEYFTEVGLSAPQPVPLVGVEYQIAQKIHALTLPGGDRSHDLVDLQLLMAHEDVQQGLTKDLCERLFAYRRQHEWPPTVCAGSDWERNYNKARDELAQSEEVLEFEKALEWVRELIALIDAAR